MYRERERAEGILENFFLAKLYNITFVNVSQVGFDLDGIVYMVKIVIVFPEKPRIYEAKNVIQKEPIWVSDEFLASKVYENIYIYIYR